MNKTILVPLDGSERAEAILPQVEEMAHCQGSCVILLQVVEYVPVVVTGHASLVERSLEEFGQQVERAKSYLAGWQEKFRESGIEAWTCVEHGPVVQTILYVAEREGVDLIAMASHGRRGLPRAFLGSVAAGIFRQAEQPLLLIRSQGSS